MNNLKIGIISGYFNPIHRGHLEYINAAKEQCNYLVCIVNNDDQVRIKGSTAFMDEQHRLEIMSNIKAIDKALIAIDNDSSVAQTLDDISNNLPHDNCEVLFFNSGDRSSINANDKEVLVCESKNIKRVYIDLPKIYSSSLLKRNLASNNIE